MYEYIRGTLNELSPYYAVVETAGVGWKIFIPFSSKMPSLGSPVTLYTSFIIRENSQSLYGFLSKQERDLFEQLLSISGVGPKTALSLVGHLDYSQLIISIRDSDTGSLCRVPGIGKKTAERIVLEVKDKLPLVSNAPPLTHDAIRALVHLGYSQPIAKKAVETVLKKSDNLDLSSLITRALKECV